MTAPTGGRVLRRPIAGRTLGGVCAGLARYFDIDPLLVRLVFVALVFAEGVGALLYLLLWLLVPAEGVAEPPSGTDAVKAGLRGMGQDVTHLLKSGRPR